MHQEKREKSKIWKCEKKEIIYIDYAEEYMDIYFKVSFLSLKDVMQNIAKLFKTELLIQFKSFIKPHLVV